MPEPADTVPPAILPGDQITYTEAEEITGYSRVHLWRLAKAGTLSRLGGDSPGGRGVRLSRMEVESLALRRYRRGTATAYWRTMPQAAEALGVSTQWVYRMGLRTRKAGNGDLLVRWQDVAREAMEKKRWRSLK